LSTSANVQTQKTAFYVLLTYIVIQLSGFLLRIQPIKSFFLQFFSQDGNEEIALAAWWSTISFAIAFLVCIFLISKNKNFWDIFKGEKASIPVSIGWGVIGFFLVFLGQSIGSLIEYSLGIDMGSENTEGIIQLSKVAPIMIIATVFLGPVLEEFVFRRVVFGSIVQTQSFVLAAIISSIIFALIHLDFSHIILYTISGFIFAFLYYRTRRLLTSIIAHMMLNGFVTIVQLNIHLFQ